MPLSLAESQEQGPLRDQSKYGIDPVIDTVALHSTRQVVAGRKKDCAGYIKRKVDWSWYLCAAVQGVALP